MRCLGFTKFGFPFHDDRFILLTGNLASPDGFFRLVVVFFLTTFFLGGGC